MKKLNFGCGTDIREGYDNVDILKGKEIDKSFNFDKFPYPLKTSSYDYIYINNVLEHLEDPEKVLEELYRITKKNGKIKIIVPHYTNKGAYSDLSHKRFFNEVSFKNFVEKRKKFKIINIHLIPTNAGRIFPKIIREKVSLFLNGLISQIDVELGVIK